VIRDGTPPAGCVLGVDAGTVRVGFAASDETQMLASALPALRRRDPRFWQRVEECIVAQGAVLAVVGLPRRADGGEGDAARMARDFAADLTARTGIPVVLWDERFTSQQAERALLAGGARRDKRRELVDSVAASFILQSWLDRHRAGRG
jgi:putative holliday junction resolvase